MTETRQRFAAKTVLVTGAGSGMGKSHAFAFAAEGADVVLSDWNDETGHAVAEQIRARGGRATFLHHDVGNADDWAEVGRQIAAAHGRLDVLVHNAGYAVAGDFHQTDLDRFNEMLAVNTVGAMLAAKTAYPLMKEAGGSIVMISSNAAKLATPIMFAYGPSKAAICQMVRTLAVQFAPERIRVNAVLPGIIDTPMSRQATQNPDILAYIMARTPMGRVGRPEEVSAAVLFLASDEASFVTGIDLPVDGGSLAV